MQRHFSQVSCSSGSVAQRSKILENIRLYPKQRGLIYSGDFLSNNEVMLVLQQTYPHTEQAEQQVLLLEFM